MSADQAKLAHQLILIINAFLRPVNEREKKAHTCHLIDRAVSEAIRGWLSRRN